MRVREMLPLVKSEGGVPYRRYSSGGARDEMGALPSEMPLAIWLNGRELVTLLCTPVQLDKLVLGFLFAERLIDAVDEVVLLGLCPDDGTAEVWLEDEQKRPSGGRTLTSGCGGGITYALEPDLPVVESQTRMRVAQIQRLLRQFLDAGRMYRETGGMHTAALSQGAGLLAVAEDVGRHNAVDKVVGECLASGLPTAGGILFTTGRISSEMLLKAARARVAILASLSSPTDRAVGLAEKLGITLIGYARGHSLRVYTHVWRIEG